MEEAVHFAEPSSLHKTATVAETPKFTGYQKFVLVILAFLQFTVILDFMILSPLGAMLMPALKIRPEQFGYVVSAYAFSAGVSGLLAGGFADRFDRKKLLLFFYVGFILGTLACGMAPTYQTLFAARMITGLFGGVIGSIVMAISTDLFPPQMRGRVMGTIQTAFAASQVLGIPLGLYLTNLWNWHMPFLMIAGLGTLAGGVIWYYLKPIDEHLKLQDPSRKPFVHLWNTVAKPRYLLAFVTVTLLSTGGFMLMPFGSAFSVHNLKINIDDLPMIYMITGVSSIFAGPLLGRASDRIGKYKIFALGSLLMIVMVSIYTRLGETSVPMVILINCIMFVGISSRMIASQALMSSVPDMASRGSFMAVSASVQQVSGGLAAALAGMIIAEAADGALVHYEILGYVVCAAIAASVVMMYFINKRVSANL